MRARAAAFLSLVVLLALFSTPSVAQRIVVPSAFSWTTNTSTLAWPLSDVKTLREQFAYASTDATIYIVGGGNTAVYGGALTLNFAELWALSPTAGWSNLTGAVTGKYSWGQLTGYGLTNSKFYSFGGRTDAYTYNDNGNAAYVATSTLNILDLTAAPTKVVASTLALTIASTPTTAVTSLTPRWGPGSCMQRGVLYVIGGVAGAVPYKGSVFTDSVIAITVATGSVAVLATTGGPTAATVAPNGLAVPLVFPSLDGTKIYVAGGVDYYANAAWPLGSLLYTYTIATNTWTSATLVGLSAAMANGWQQYAAAGNGAVVVGGQTGAGDSTASFLIDVTGTAPTVTALPSPSDARESAGFAILPTGQAFLFLGATYPTLASSLASRYWASTLPATAFVPSPPPPPAPAGTPTSLITVGLQSNFLTTPLSFWTGAKQGVYGTTMLTSSNCTTCTQNSTFSGSGRRRALLAGASAAATTVSGFSSTAAASSFSAVAASGSLAAAVTTATGAATTVTGVTTVVAAPPPPASGAAGAAVPAVALLLAAIAAAQF